MNKYINYLYRPILIFSIIFCLVLQVNRKLVYPNMGYDYMLKARTLNSFLKGNGFSVPFSSDPKDLSVVTHAKQGLWPQGYNFISLPILVLNDFDILKAYKIIDVLALFFLISVWIAILWILKKHFSKWIFPIIFMFWGSSFYPFKEIGVTDTISLAFISLSIFFLLRLSNTKNNVITSIFIGLFSFLPCFFRFAYYPYIIIIPILCFILYFVTREKKYNYWWLAVITSMVLLLIQVVFQKFYFGYVDIISEVVPNSTHLLHFKNLQLFDAVFLNSLVLDNLIYRVFAIPNGWLTYELFKELFTLSTFVAIIYFSLHYFYLKNIILSKNIVSILRNKFTFFLLILFLLGSANILIITLLSLKYPSFAFSNEIVRSYVMFPRYMAMTISFIQLSFISILFLKKDYIPVILKWIGRCLIAIAFCFNFSYWGYHEIKFKLYEHPVWKEAQNLTEIIEKEKYYPYTIIHTNKNNNQNYNTFWGLLSIKAYSKINYLNIRKSRINSSKPLYALIEIPIKKGSYREELLSFMSSYPLEFIQKNKTLNKEIYIIKLL